jgi:hypothetical protein
MGEGNAAGPCGTDPFGALLPYGKRAQKWLLA